VASVAGVPGDPDVLPRRGGWRRVEGTDSGQSWEPVFDNMPVQASVRSPWRLRPDQVWAGTGEAWVIRDSDIGGDGVYKSTDAGKTWKNVGLPDAGRIGRIIVHPTNPNIVYVCAIGRVTAPQQERGVYRTLDGGATWERSLFVDPNTGCSGISMDPNHPDVLIAGMWQVELHTWAMFSGGPGSGVYLTHDGGKTWTKPATGMPRSPVGKSTSRLRRRIHSGYADSDAVKARVTDRKMAARHGRPSAGSHAHRLAGCTSMKVNPQNPDDLFILNSGFHRSAIRRHVWRRWRRGRRLRRCHDVWIDQDGRRFVLTDGGARIPGPTGSQACRCRSRAISRGHRQSDAIGSTATGGTTGRCAGRRTRQ
jgi:hypothetical protein